MADKCQATWKLTEEQVDKIILPAMQGIAQQCASHMNERQCPPEFIALMLRDIADAVENPSQGESECGSCIGPIPCSWHS